MTVLDSGILARAYGERFKAAPLVAAAPGRVNLIGEHTDYNDGFVLPVAIDRAVSVAAGPSGGRTFKLFSLDFDQAFEFEPDNLVPTKYATWANYVMGVVSELLAAGVKVPGACLVIAGDVPFGAGLSSSAALEVACATALTALAGEELDPAELARLCHRAENDFVGMRCGVMDQFIAALGREGHALLLDCRAESWEQVPLALGGHLLVVANTGVARGLAGSRYNERRAECEEAVARLRGAIPGITALRDVTGDDLTRHGRVLPQRLLRRARHVVTENERVLAAAEAMRRGDLGRLGELLYASHESLRRDFEVSSPELDRLVELASGVPGVVGSRMTGAGFGGCTVSIVAEEALPQFASGVSDGYEAIFGKKPDIYPCRSSDGARVTRRPS